MNKEDIGSALHTALRKLCDSKPTSIVWNAIHLLDDELWESYVSCIEETIRGKDSTTETIKSQTLRFWEDAPISALRNIMKCGFDLFDDVDWSNYAYWIVVKEEAKESL